MIYKILIGKNEIRADEEEKDFFVNNQDKKFVALKSGELVNVAFVQGIIIDHEATREENKYLKMKNNNPQIEGQVENPFIDIQKYKPDFLKEIK